LIGAGLGRSKGRSPGFAEYDFVLRTLSVGSTYLSYTLSVNHGSADQRAISTQLGEISMFPDPPRSLFLLHSKFQLTTTGIIGCCHERETTKGRYVVVRLRPRSTVRKFETVRLILAAGVTLNVSLFFAEPQPIIPRTKNNRTLMLGAQFKDPVYFIRRYL
jgi:hypothetical protein